MVKTRTKLAANQSQYHLKIREWEAINVPNVCTESLPITEYAANKKPILAYIIENSIILITLPDFFGSSA